VKGTRATSGLLRRSGRKIARETRKGIFLTVSVGCAILAGLFFNSTPSARAGEDNERVSITPAIPPHPGELSRRSDSIRVDVNLVLIPVTVTDSYERPVIGLQKSDFHLFEDGSERQISNFFSQETPISVGIVFDASASMKRKMEHSLRAVREFLKLSLPGDEFCLTKFNDRPEPVLGFTSAATDIEQRLLSVQPQGWTALFDAIYLGVHQMKHASHTRKVLLILSDGGDNNSRYSGREVKQFVQESDVRIFSISILDHSPSLDAIAEESGGRAFRVQRIDELPDLAANISAEIHSEYVLGYSPSDHANDGQYRKIKVALEQTVRTARLRASWKRGYYAPSQ
jgi:Ca-activated chloride channel family protein